MGSFRERIKESSAKSEVAAFIEKWEEFNIILSFTSSDCSHRSLISEGLPLF